MVQLSSVVRPFVCHRCTVAKQCETKPRLLVITNNVAHWLSSNMKINALG